MQLVNILSAACRLCQGCGANDDILMAALGSMLPGRAVMLQSSGSFFAYEPILKALQTTQTLPLANYIAATKLPPALTRAVEATTNKAGSATFVKDLLRHGNRLFGIREAQGEPLFPQVAS